jgi:hypothetical protein
MSILRTTNSGQRVYWHKQIASLGEKIEKMLKEEIHSGKDSIWVHYDCPCGYKDKEKKKISTYRCRVEFWKADKFPVTRTLEYTFSSAVDGTVFVPEDIPISTITIDIQRG